MSNIAERAIQAEDTIRQRDLVKMKWIAASLLGFAAGLYVVGKVYSLGYLAAFAEAAMIGALADWFAVVALFRHPLGIPIPHTAIIARNKRSIANSLADFVVGQFLSAEVIGQRLKRYDAAFHLSQWLVLPGNRLKVAAYLGKAVAYGVKALDDRRIHDFIAQSARNKLQNIDLSGFMASGLELVTRNQSHRKILHGGLNRFADYVESPDNTDKISAFIKGWSDNSFVQSMIEPFVPTIRTAVVNKLRAAAEDETNGLYLEFDEQVKSYVLRLQQDPELQEWVSRQKNTWLNHPEFGRQIESLWSQLRDWVVLDLSHPDSVITGKIVNLVGELELYLATNEEIRSWINDQIQAALIRAANANKGMVGDLIREEFGNWDDNYMVNKLELYLGRDLQYIRINGTLVGGLFGLLIYGVTQLVAS
ncbi:MAG: DUF445 domain-containing protein [Gallionella sp.]|jgi:uncharacterized membrane-anchored protein YjiN (DUF445 family)